jgi:hypothetical protein
MKAEHEENMAAEEHAHWEKRAERSESGAVAGCAPVELEPCVQCGGDPEKHCTAGRARGREPHDLDGAWIRCGRCGNSITVMGRQAVRRARLAWNIRA